MHQVEYERNEARLLAKQLRGVKAAPLPVRKAASWEWQEAMAESPDVVGERVEWLLMGHYGYGACRAATEIATGTLRNKPAAAGQLIAALEWGCPDDFARQAWRDLTDAQQEAVTAAITEALKTDPAVTT